MSDTEIHHLLERGNDCLAEGMIEFALTYYEQAVSLDTDCPEAHFNMGVARLRQDRPDEAESHFQTAARLAPELLEASRTEPRVGRSGAGDSRSDEEAGESDISVDHILPSDPGISIEGDETVTSDAALLEDVEEDFPSFFFSEPDERGIPDTSISSGLEVGPHPDHEKGLEHLRKGDPEGAIPHLEEATRKAPDVVAHRFDLGLAHLMAGHPDRALTAFRLVIAEEPKLADAHYHLGRACLALERSEEAEEAFREALRHDPRRTDVHHQIGLCRQIQGLHAAACRSFERGLEKDPDNDATLYHLSLSQLALGEPEAARKTARKAVGREPANPNRLEHLALCTLKAGRAKKAIGHFRDLIRLDPDRATAHSNLAVAFIQTRQYEEAVDALQRAIDLDPTYAAAHSNLGIAYTNLGRFGAAVDHLMKAIDLDPSLETERTCRLIGCGYAQEGLYKKGCKWLERALEKRPTYEAARKNLAAACRRWGRRALNDDRPADAIPRLQRSLELVPDSIGGHEKLALALQLTRRHADAIPHLEKVISLSETPHPEASYNLACCHALEGNREKALESLRRAVAYGYKNWQLAREDDDLAAVREMPDFQDIIRAMGATS